MSIYTASKTFITKHKFRLIIGLLIILLILIVGLISGSTPSPSETASGEDNLPTVEVATANLLATGGSGITTVGRVEAISESDLTVQTSGRILRVLSQVGDQVGPGQLILELENNQEQAALEQAEAALEQAELQLAITKRGARGEQVDTLETSVETRRDQLTQAKEDAYRALNNNLAEAQAAIKVSADQFFINPEQRYPYYRYSPGISDSSDARDIEEARSNLSNLFRAWEDIIQENEPDTVLEAYDEVEPLIDRLTKFARDLAFLTADLKPYSDLSDSEVQSLKQQAASVQTTISTVESSLSQAMQAVENAENNLALAQGEQTFNTTAGSEEVAVAEATVKQRRSALESAQIAYQKTQLRAPIEGTIVDLSAKEGDVVTSFTSVGKIVNDGGIEITAFLSNRQVTDLRVGDQAVVSGEIPARIIRIQETLEENTGKREIVLIPLADNQLTDGEVVPITISGDQSTSVSDTLLVPIKSVRFSNGSATLLVVEDGQVREIPVDTGALQGTNLEINSLLDPDLQIILDARGIKPGDRVTVDIND